jgi:OOP family OmpA-OmpF porin
MKKIRMTAVVSVLLGLALILALPLNASAGIVKRVDNFIIFLDQSGSMEHHKHAELGQNKLDLAVDTIARMDKVIPELGYTSTAAVFAPYKVLADTVVYKSGSLGPVVAASTALFNQWTTMGDGLTDLGQVISGLSVKTALIIFTDGDANAGTDAVAAAQALYAANPGKLCIHVVSFADTASGKQTIEKIRALSGCSVAADAASLASDAALQQFAKDVLYEDAAPVVKKPAPVVKKPAPVVKEVISFNLLFGVDKSDITDEMVPILEQAKMILDEDRKSVFVVAGHTDATGAEAYNQGLSERRAASVKEWLVNNGVAASRLETAGYGENSPKYDNGTVEGRRLNRRVEMVSK